MTSRARALLKEQKFSNHIQSGHYFLVILGNLITFINSLLWFIQQAFDLVLVKVWLVKHAHVQAHAQ